MLRFDKKLVSEELHFHKIHIKVITMIFALYQKQFVNADDGSKCKVIMSNISNLNVLLLCVILINL